jgi:hypothetical protein
METVTKSKTKKRAVQGTGKLSPSKRALYEEALAFQKARVISNTDFMQRSAKEITEWLEEFIYFVAMNAISEHEQEKLQVGLDKKMARIYL